MPTETCHFKRKRKEKLNKQVNLILINIVIINEEEKNILAKRVSVLLLL